MYHESVCADEPYNATFKAPPAPTIPAEDTLKVPTKYNFAETFDRPVWQVRMERPVVFASGIPKNNKDGSDMLENFEQKYGCLDPKLIEKHNLTVSSRPEDFMEVLFPYEDNDYSTTKK